MNWSTIVANKKKVKWLFIENVLKFFFCRVLFLSNFGSVADDDDDDETLYLYRLPFVIKTREIFIV